MKPRLLVLVLALAAASGAEPLQWPAGKGVDLVQKNCLICHSGELIQGQRLSKEAWTKEVDKMAGWGSPVPTDLKAQLVEYLATHYSPDTPETPPAREKFSFKK